MSSSRNELYRETDRLHFDKSPGNMGLKVGYQTEFNNRVCLQVLSETELQ